MIDLQRQHDFQVFISPSEGQASPLNPPRFNWPQQNYHDVFTFELENLTSNQTWTWQDVCSPFAMPIELPFGEYRWRLVQQQAQSEWLTFTIDSNATSYLPPSAQALFQQCADKDQFLMYLDEDIDLVRQSSQDAYHRLKTTASFTDLEAITYPNHYRRGLEEGKRTAITNVREWIDRDLIAHCLLFKIWGEQEHGDIGIQLLLRIAEWSPEGPASLLRPCTWGDEVGLSLSRNLFLAYHWLSPLLTESEKDFIRPMLVRIAYQMEDRLESDKFKQFPGHSHTSRLPSYLGLAALTLHKEFEYAVCERWLSYALMIYQNVLPFYGGDDGSWAEGPFYSSSYSKWHHPFFLTVERLSDFSFYNQPFYQNYHTFVMDFVATDESIHPFSDGFWCKRDGKEWPGFFAQNPLRIYAERFGDAATNEISKQLESKIDSYDLHLLDVIPTVKQLEYTKRTLNPVSQHNETIYNQYYPFAGLGKLRCNEISLYFRASQFGNSSHRHADQGNIALIDDHQNVLVPSGSYGYRFGSSHHSDWTRQTKAHNLPLIDGVGQILDDNTAVAHVVTQQSGKNWSLAHFNLTSAYNHLSNYIRTVIVIEGQGMLLVDHLQLPESKPLQWRLHSELDCQHSAQSTQLIGNDLSYQVELVNHSDVTPVISQGYDLGRTQGQQVVSDANPDIFHLEWTLPEQQQHLVIASIAKSTMDYKVQDQSIISVDTGTEHIRLDIKSNTLIIS